MDGASGPLLKGHLQVSFAPGAHQEYPFIQTVLLDLSYYTFCHDTY